MSFFRKAFNKISNATDGHNGVLKASPSTTALPALSFQHDPGEAFWDGTSPPGSTALPIRLSNSNSSISPASRISLAEKESFKTDDFNVPLPPPKSRLSPGSYREASLPAMPTDDGLPRHRTPKKPSNSSFRPFLANLAGLKVSSLDRDKADTHWQDHSEPDVSPLFINSPEDLSSNASTPIDNLPPPPSKGEPRSRRKRRQQNITAVVQSLAGPTYSPYTTPQAAVDSTRRLEEAAIQARLNAAIVTEPSGVLPEDPATSCSGDDEGPSIRVEANVDIEPASFIHSLEDNIDSSPPSTFDGVFPWNEPVAVPPTQEQHFTNDDSTFDRYLNGTLEKLDSDDEKIHSQSLKDDRVEQPPILNIPESGDIHNYSYSLLDHYTAPSTTPPPISASSSVHHVTSPQTRQLEEEIRLLRSRLAESKTRIDALAEEKMHTMQNHHREVLILSNSIKTLEQKESGYHTQIKGLLSEKESLREDRDDVVQQLKHQIEENENLENVNKELQKESLVFRDFKLRMRDNEIKFQQLFKEKDSWQGQIDDMHHRLSDAERRVRSLDVITRRKYEAKQERAYGSGSVVGRSMKLHFSPHVKGPSMDLISSVTIFNEEVLQTASYVVEHLEEMPSNSSLVMPKELTRAKDIWGPKIVTMLQEQAPNHVGSQLNFLLLQNCLEVFMTHWCVQIAEGWYPKQPSFSDILVELTAPSHTVGYNGLGKQHVCGKQIKIIPTESTPPDFASWVKDIVQDLTSILTVGGVRMPVLKTTLLPAKIEPLLKLAYNLRLALAERDICGGLEIAAPSPGVPFHPQFMEDAEESALQKSRKKKVDNPGLSWLDGEYIAGTSGMGLKRTLNGQPGVYEMVVKPKVSLIRVLETVF